MRLANGTLFPMLITLFVSDPRGVKVGNCAVPRNDVLGRYADRGNFFYGLCSVKGFGPWDERRSSPAGDRDIVVGFVLHFWALTVSNLPKHFDFPELPHGRTAPSCA
jgi:hypothetical protein